MPVKGSSGIRNRQFHLPVGEVQPCLDSVNDLLIGLAGDAFYAVNAVIAGGAEEVKEQGIAAFAYPVNIADDVAGGGDANGRAVFARRPCDLGTRFGAVDVVLYISARAVGGVAERVGTHNQIAGLLHPVGGEDDAVVFADGNALGFQIKRPYTAASCGLFWSPRG